MEYLENLLSHFDLIETFVIKATILISAILFCLGYIWNHIKGFGSKNQSGKNHKGL